MKKIYSIVLMATALLIGTNVWATTRDEIQAAIDNAADGGTVNITLNSDVKVGQYPIQIYAKKAVAGKTVNINFNGHQIVSETYITKDSKGNDVTNQPAVIIDLFKGTLNLTGKGGITTQGKTGIKVYGADDPAKANWSVLNVGQEVRIISELKEAIGIYGFYGPRCAYVKPEYAGEYLYGDPADYKVAKYVYQDKDGGAVKTASTSAGIALVTSGAIDYSTSFFKAGTTVYNLTGKDGNQYTYVKAAGEYTKAYGVNITVDGYLYGKEYGIKANGTLKFPRTSDTDNMPYVHVTSTAEVACQAAPTNADDRGSTAIYASGCAEWLIEGYVHGNIGVYVKSGDIKLNDAVVESENKTGTHNPVQGTSSGVKGGEGSAIVIESNKNYAGGQEVTVSGDTRVSGANGYAVEEIITNPTGTKVESIKIEGGTFETGENGAGAMSFTQGTTEDAEVVVYGANVTGSVSIGSDDDKLSDLLPADTHITEVIGEGGKTILVVSEGEAPKGYATIALALAENKKSVKLTGSDEIAANATVTIDELEMNEISAQTLTINDGAVFKVGRVILGVNAQIIVKAGAKFIVTGEQGIVAPKASNIVLCNADGKRSIFLFNPAVSSNRHPNATVELLTKSWWEDAANYQWENFGLPTYGEVENITCDKVGDKVVYAELSVYENSAWNSLGYIGGTYTIPTNKLNKPFVACNIIAYRTRAEEAPKVKVSGKLIGNDNAPLNAYMKWTPFANSYTAELDGATFLNMLKTEAVNIDPYFYIAKSAGLGSLTWEPIDAEEPENIQPMQAFLLNNQGTFAETNTINYNSMIWTPATKASAPSRYATNENTAKMRVIVANEQGAWDVVKFRENSSNSVCEKYMNEDVNIYATVENKAAIVANENLENTYVGFSTVKGGNFTINFANVEGRQFDLIDHETGARVAMVEGNVYEFKAAANTSNDYRFEIVSRHDAPTAIDNVEATKSAKGIYTITGQYVGEMSMWNTLPAGVYVVDGAKRVK